MTHFSASKLSHYPIEAQAEIRDLQEQIAYLQEEKRDILWDCAQKNGYFFLAMLVCAILCAIF